MKKITAVFAIVALLSFASPALAHGGHYVSSDDITVTNHNSASVRNTVNVSASTGGNDANGGTGSAAGNGGDGNHSDDHNAGGNGGNAGHGGWGRYINTGDAEAGSGIVNLVNTNITRIRR